MPSSASRCTQETTSAYASFRGATPAMSSSKSRSIAQYTIYDKDVGRLRGVRIALKRSSRSVSFLRPYWRPSWILVTGLQHQLQEWFCSPWSPKQNGIRWLSSPSRLKDKDFSGHFVGHLVFWWPDCNAIFRKGFAAVDNPYKVVLGDSLVHLE